MSTGNPIVDMLVSTIESGTEQINEANKSLLGESEDGKTPVREIDKILKDADNDVPDDVRKTWQKAEKARETYKSLLNEARNLYRTKVLGEEEVSESESEVDKEALKEVRKSVMTSLDFLKVFASTNGLKDQAEWAENFEVPQIGRRGTSSVSGVKRPRAFVTVDGTTYDTFTLAAQAISTKDEKVTASELSEGWDGNDGSTWTVGEHTVSAVSKPKKSTAA